MGEKTVRRRPDLTLFFMLLMGFAAWIQRLPERVVDYLDPMEPAQKQKQQPEVLDWNGNRSVLKPMRTRFSRLPILLRRLQQAEPVVIYEGLPHQTWQSDLKRVERSLAATLSFPGGDEFYADPLPVPPADAMRIAEILLTPGTYTENKISGFCPWFNPDFAVVFGVGSDAVRITVDQLCHRVHLDGTNVWLPTRLSREAHDGVFAILELHHRHRPISRQAKDVYPLLHLLQQPPRQLTRRSSDRAWRYVPAERQRMDWYFPSVRGRMDPDPFFEEETLLFRMIRPSLTQQELASVEVRLLSASVRGALPLKPALRVVVDRMATLRECVAVSRRYDDSASGQEPTAKEFYPTWKLQVAIDSSGSPLTQRPPYGAWEGQANDFLPSLGPAGRCIRDRLNATQFPATQSGTSILTLVLHISSVP